MSMRSIRSPSGRAMVTPKGRTPQVKAHLDPAQRQAMVYATPQWRSLRAAFRKAGWTTCVCCRVTASALLDHVVPVQQRPSHAFDPENLQPLCKICHSRKTMSIDAPQGDPSRYRAEKAHLADMRPVALQEWAAALAPLFLKRFGSFAAGSKLPSPLADWVPSC
jgi:5-methylcytosine-specific restriction endonuclease McrA